jgi:c(7)-type cytochrome triheme protein
MLRVLLFVLIVACVGCGGGGGGSKAPADKTAAKLEGPLVTVATVDAATAKAPSGTPPVYIDYPSEYGQVRFTHKQHYERVNSDCSTCHTKIFPQSLEPLNYGKARHRDAEEYKTSCATCHGISSSAFAAERNCQKCHAIGNKQ